MNFIAGVSATVSTLLFGISRLENNKLKDEIHQLNMEHILYKEQFEPHVCYNSWCTCMDYIHKPYSFMCDGWAEKHIPPPKNDNSDPSNN